VRVKEHVYTSIIGGIKSPENSTNVTCDISIYRISVKKFNKKSQISIACMRE